MEADEKICLRCAETAKAAAKVCRHCGYDFEAGGAPPPVGTVRSEINKGGKIRSGCLIALVMLAVLIVIGALVNPDENGADADMAEFALEAGEQA